MRAMELILDEAEGLDTYMTGRPMVVEMTPLNANTLILANAGPAEPQSMDTFLEPNECGKFRLRYSPAGRLSRRMEC